ANLPRTSPRAPCPPRADAFTVDAMAVRTGRRSVAAAIVAVLAVSASLALASEARADTSTASPLPLTAAGCVQSFDSLAATGTSSAFPAGFGLAEAGSNADPTYAAGDGTSNAGNTYSFGATGATERALGGVASGSLRSRFGVLARNDTGATVTSLTV